MPAGQLDEPGDEPGANHARRDGLLLVHKARANDDVRTVGLHTLRHDGDVLGHVLSVRVKLYDGVVAVLERVAAPGLEAAREAKVDGVAHVVEAAPLADGLGLVRGAVIDHEVVHAGARPDELVHRGLDAPLLVVCGDDC